MNRSLKTGTKALLAVLCLSFCLPTPSLGNTGSSPVEGIQQECVRILVQREGISESQTGSSPVKGIQQQCVRRLVQREGISESQASYLVDISTRYERQHYAGIKAIQIDMSRNGFGICVGYVNDRQQLTDENGNRSDEAVFYTRP